MPFRFFTDIQTMKSIVTPPPRHAFVNELPNSGNEPVGEMDYASFKWAWDTFECRHLFDLEKIYLTTDTCQLCDLVSYHFRKIHR